MLFGNSKVRFSSAVIPKPIATMAHGRAQTAAMWFDRMIALFSFSSWLTSPSQLWIWEWLEFASIIVVGVGCWGEVWAQHYRFTGRPNNLTPTSLLNKRWERRFWLMVVWGLPLELVAFGSSFTISNREIEDLQAKNLTTGATLEADLSPQMEFTITK